MNSWYYRIRYGRPLVLVSGLPRSGTSMLMQMLERGGMETVTDNRRTADEDNPQGDHELASMQDRRQKLAQELPRASDQDDLFSRARAAVGSELPSAFHAPESRRGAALAEQNAGTSGRDRRGRSRRKDAEELRAAFAEGLLSLGT